MNKANKYQQSCRIQDQQDKQIAFIYISHELSARELRK